jgi:hypothetical protein
VPTITSRPGPIQASRTPATPSVVVPRASLNDNGQSVLVNPSGLVVLSGKGINRGTVAAALSVEFDGRRVRVPVSRDQTPAQTMAKLGQSLPAGYELKREASRAFGDGVAFTIRRKDAQPAPKALIPTVSENDPGLRAQVDPSSGKVTLSGKANNRGTVASFFKLDVDGQSVRFPLRGGETPRATMALVEKALPAGYALKPAVVRSPGGDVVAFTIEKKSAPPPRSNVDEIDAQFAKASKKSSTAGVKVGVNELRKAVELAEKGGLSADDRDALARNWAGLFNGAEWRATPAAQKEFARLQERLDLPVYPVR